ncbi:UDP-N-acetylglucosamine 2-epimerase (non-hydrolyzing) [Candidatus Micrarchaeota archaeon]|nr:UDP-N-acetylglucosamine 2-epimerase (non-hydrolyzing) [Candidatus Micrarchaeota archaeon]
MKIAIALGTRPEIIKLSPVIRELEARAADYFIIHSNQHYSYEMDRIFFEELELPKPKYNLGVRSASNAKQIAQMMQEMEEILLKEKPDVLFVQGDTNTVLASAIAAHKIGILIAHIEAGLRSFDRRMPEEANRIIVDHISDYLFPPTNEAKLNLRREGIGLKEMITWRGPFTPKIFVTGNTSVDATKQNLDLAEETFPNYVESLGLKPKEYLLVTAHRAENVDRPEVLKEFLEAFREISTETNKKVIYPIHPRTRKRVEEFGLTTKGIKIIDPPGYLEFLLLQKSAACILTDSGGVQEEACTLGIPCVVLRKSSDRPESISAGGAILGGVEKNEIKKAFGTIQSAKSWPNPYGNGFAARQIVDEVIKGLL